MAEDDSGMMSGDGPLSNFNPGERVRSVMGSAGPDMSQGPTLNTPENPGPAALGRTPLIGMVRRDRGLPVIRDQVPNLMED